MISIPTPCNEDFSKMTPTERGAFCTKCSTDTFDFRNLSDIRINELLFKNKDEHLCGQFTNVQLKSLNRGFENWKNQKNQTFKSKFVLALVLVFGLALFSCDSQEKQQIMALQTIELVEGKQADPEFVNQVLSAHDLNLTDFLDAPMEIPIDVDAPSSCQVRGKVAVIKEETKTEIEDEIMVTAGEAVLYHVTAGIVYEYDYMNYLQDTINTVELIDVDSGETETVVDFFKAEIFPNPTISTATLRLDIEVEEVFEITVYDMQGRLVKQVYNGVLPIGQQNFRIDLETEQTGMYLVKVISNGQDKSVKVQKMN